MISTKDIALNNLLNTIEIVLQNTYGLTPFDARTAIKESKIADVYIKNCEQSSHNSIEDWAEAVYKFWKNNN